MLKKKLTKSILIVLLVGMGLSLFSLPVQAGCFARFEKCLRSVRTSFFGGAIDTLDCEVELVGCIRRALFLDR